MVKNKKSIQTSGKRKSAVARVNIKSGSGIVKINNVNLESWGTALLRMRIKEPLLLANNNSFDINVSVHGGGSVGQADAIRLAIGRALVEHDSKLKTTFLDYDRQLLVADIRRKESAKPNSHGKARAKRQKSYR